MRWFGLLLTASVGLAPIAAQTPIVISEPVPIPEPLVATVTVTNMAKGQILTPMAIYTHDETTPPLYQPGQPSTPELARLAEQGVTSGLLNRARAGSSVFRTTRHSAFIRPGQTSSASIEFDADHRRISLASMIEMTNDGFIALAGVEIPCSGSKTIDVVGWDAGSEANTELC